jgi:hypothetical protein
MDRLGRAPVVLSMALEVACSSDVTVAGTLGSRA